MIVNDKYYFTLPSGDTSFNIPIELKWDNLGKDDLIEIYEDQVVTEIVGAPEDFEVNRYSHDPYTNGAEPVTLTKIKYEFNFYNITSPVTASTSPSNWVNSYIFNSYVSNGFAVSQVYYFEKPFTKSFFKLDFYDSADSAKQTNYLTIILPTQQGDTETKTISVYKPPVKIKKPYFNLDFIGDKEGFFIYWLRDSGFLNIDTFYMTAKFFDARRGEYVKMMNRPQSSLSDKFNFRPDVYFYYKVVLDKTKKTYKVFNYSNNRVGTTQPIKWYEYVNP
jgi:hypothetical protein